MSATEQATFGSCVVKFTERSDQRFALWWTEGGKTCRSTAKDRPTAVKKAKALAKALDARHGSRLVCITDAEVARRINKLAGSKSGLAMVAEIDEALRLLAGRATLVEAATLWVDNGPGRVETKLVAEAVAVFLEEKEGAELSKYTKRTHRDMFNKFSEMFGEIRLAEVSVEVVEGFAGRTAVEPRTYNNRVDSVAGFLNWSKARSWLPDEPTAADRVTRRKELYKSPSIFEPATAKAILDLLLEKAPRLVPFFAVGCFAGCRPHEIAGGESIRWGDFKWSKGYLEIRPEVAGKVGGDRFIPLAANLLAILKPLKKADGKKISGVNHPRQISKLAREAGLIAEWTKDVMRHSFISYRLAETQDRAKVAEEAGNSPTVIAKHYRRPVEVEVAEEWFEVGK